MYTDTDSFIYNIQTDDLCRDFSLHFKSIMDFCDYPENHILYNLDNRKRIGFLKDEANGVHIREFIGLKPKMYFILLEEKIIKRAKGVSKSVLSNEIFYKNYYDAVMNQEFCMHSARRLQSMNHKIFALEERKLSLSPLDYKRYIMDDGISTLEHGHTKIKNK